MEAAYQQAKQQRVEKEEGAWVEVRWGWGLGGVAMG